MIKARQLWWVRGLFWGTLIFLIMALALPYAQGDPITLNKTMWSFLIWMSGGLLYGWLTTLFEKRSQQEKKEHAN